MKLSVTKDLKDEIATRAAKLGFEESGMVEHAMKSFDLRTDLALKTSIDHSSSLTELINIRLPKQLTQKFSVMARHRGVARDVLIRSAHLSALPAV